MSSLLKSHLLFAKCVAVGFWFGIAQVSRSSPTSWGLSNSITQINAVSSQTLPWESWKASFLAWSPTPRLVRCLNTVVLCVLDLGVSWPGLGSSCHAGQGVGELQVQTSTEKLWDALWSPLEVGHLASGRSVSTSWGIWLRLVTEVEFETSPVLKRSLNWTLCSHHWEGMVAVRIWVDECCRATSRELFKIVKAFFLHFSLLFLFCYNYNKWLRQSTTEFDPESLKNAGSGPIIFICRG